MIILDTNVLSALMREQPDPTVLRWLDEQAAESMWITSITVLEVRTGLELLPSGKRLKRLEESFSELLRSDLDSRILAFEESAAHAAAVALASARRLGQQTEIRDGQIAGIALSRRATLATRNVKDFEPLGVTTVDPWSA